MNKSNDNKKNLIISIVAILLLCFLVYLAVKLISINRTNEIQETGFLVVNVTDGDTFEIATGEKVRLICIDTPEKGEAGYKEASEFLGSLILGQVVKLEKDENASAIETIDAYGRLLRYVYLNTTEGEVFINKEMVSKGYATLFPYGNSTSKCGEIGGKI